MRNCYEETIAFNSDDFATMIFVDAIFLLEFFLRGFRGDFTTSDDRIYGKPRLIDQLIGDLWLLENQLPLFILDELFDLAKAATYGDYYERLSLFRISYWFWRCGFTKFPIDKDLLDTKFSEAKHFLDLPRLCLQPPQSRVQIKFRRQKCPVQRSCTSLESNLMWGLAKIHLTSHLIKELSKFHLLQYMMIRRAFTEMF